MYLVSHSFFHKMVNKAMLIGFSTKPLFFVRKIFKFSNKLYHFIHLLWPMYTLLRSAKLTISLYILIYFMTKERTPFPGNRRKSVTFNSEYRLKGFLLEHYILSLADNLYLVALFYFLIAN